MTDTTATQTTQNTQPTSTPAATTADNGSSTPASFLDTLPQDFRTDPAFKAIKSIDDLAKSYSHAVKFVGMDKNEIARKPKDTSPEQEWDGFYDFIGRPKSYDEYKVPVIDPDQGIEFDDAFAKSMKEISHKNGLTSKQFENVMGYYAQTHKAMIAAQKAQAEQKAKDSDAALRAEWGKAYDEKVRDVDNFIRAFGGEDLKKAIQESGILASNPGLVKALANAGKELREHPSISGDGGPGAGALTPNEAIMKIKENRSDKEFMKRYMEGEVKAKGEMERLYQFAYPNAKKVI